MGNRVAEIVEYHLTREKIIYRIKEGEDLFIVRSIKRINESYIVIKENDKWSCDCHSFKYHSGTSPEGYCKHILSIIFLLQEGVEITLA